MTRGPTYLVATGDELLPKLAKRALADLRKARPRVAVTYAPVAGDKRGLKFMSGRMPALFPGAVLETLDGDRSVVDRADLVFVSGGDPTHGAKVLAASGADAWLREANARGVPVMGVSAGAILLGAFWIDWPEDEDAPEEQADLVACAGVLPGHVFDAHDEEDGWEELHAASRIFDRTLRNGTADRVQKSAARPQFLGIPSGGALVFHDGGEMEVVGHPPFALR